MQVGVVLAAARLRGIRRATAVLSPSCAMMLIYGSGRQAPVRTGDRVIPALDPATGWLPLGRHHCSQAEIETAFATSSTRTAIWRDWQSGLQLLQTAVTVHAAWVGGSFTTAKPDPEDLDVTFLINGEDMRHRSAGDLKIITIFATAGQAKARLGLNLDSYVVPWECVPQPRPRMSIVHDGYFWARGHWDDWWQRNRLSSKTSPPTPADTLPRRGYLEVALSDYP